MSALMNQQCLEFFLHSETLYGEHSFRHDYVNPWGKAKTTLYKVNFDTLMESNPDSQNERPIRLIALSIKRQGAEKGGDSPQGGGDKSVYQQGGSTSSGTAGQSS